MNGRYRRPRHGPGEFLPLRLLRDKLLLARRGEDQHVRGPLEQLDAVVRHRHQQTFYPIRILDGRRPTENLVSEAGLSLTGKPWRLGRPRCHAETTQESKPSPHGRSFLAGCGIRCVRLLVQVVLQHVDGLAPRIVFDCLLAVLGLDSDDSDLVGLVVVDGKSSR